MSRHTAAALLSAALALGIAFVGLALILSPQASADGARSQPVADADRTGPQPAPRPSDASSVSSDGVVAAGPTALPTAGSGGLADDGPATQPAFAGRATGSRSELTPFLSALSVSAILGLVGWGFVRRWCPVPDAAQDATTAPESPGAHDRSA